MTVGRASELHVCAENSRMVRVVVICKQETFLQVLLIIVFWVMLASRSSPASHFVQTRFIDSFWDVKFYDNSDVDS